jgi:hypothetical protein
MYAMAAGLVYASMRLNTSKEVYGMISMLLGVVVREIGSNGQGKSRTETN